MAPKSTLLTARDHSLPAAYISNFVRMGIALSNGPWVLVTGQYGYPLHGILLDFIPHTLFFSEKITSKNIFSRERKKNKSHTIFPDTGTT